MPLVSTFGAAASRGFGLFSAPAAVIGDEYFEYVTMLLPGNGTNGAQNNTFLDSSTNNFTITRNGNTTQGTFSPYGDNWSNYFDGTGDYLTAPDNAAWDFGTSDFTIEVFVFPLNLTGDKTLVSNYDTSSGFSLQRNGSVLRFYVGGTTLATSTNSLVANSWNHCVAVRSGTSLSLYVNGSRGANVTNSTNFTGSTQPLTIGNISSLLNQAFDGYLSNVRIVKGTAVYDPTQTTIAVPTAPLTAITNTSLLTCQSNRFIDNSTNAFAITRNGDVSVQRFSPFSPTASYDPATIGGSGYFDGSGDYLQTSSGTTLGTGDFTVEAWVFNTTSGQKPEIWINGGQVGQFVVSTNFNAADAGVILGALSPAGSGWSVTLTGSTALAANAWNHIAWVRASGVITVYLNGVAGGTYSNSSNSISLGRIGAFDSVNYDLNGYISNLRVVAGTAVYTAAFTPPTAPVTAITNTSLLLNFTNAGIIDNAMMNDLETVGNAQISTTQSKFGGSSMYFDGTGDWLTTAASNVNNFGTSDWTIEFWINSIQTSRADVIGWNYFYGDAGWGGLLLNVSSSGQMSWYENTNARINATSTGWNNGAWNHIAITRSGNSVRMFLNGVQQGSTYTTSFSYGANSSGFNIGNAAGSGGTNGYIDDLRITKGVARYTANFTPPTQAFPTR